MLIRKGPYWASESDFASAGSLHMAYANRLETNLLSVTGGIFGYWRGLAAGSMNVGAGTLTAAGEIVRYDGACRCPTPPAIQRLPALQRRHRGQRFCGHGARLHELLAFHRPDSAACRARRLAEPFRRVDQTDGGDAQRYSLSARWSRANEKSASKVEGYFIYQTLNLYNNFTYFLDNPADGDQFQQTDKRKILGLNASHTENHSFLGLEAATTLGTRFRYDDIAVGLFNTAQRVPTGTVRTTMSARPASAFMPRAR